jgi:predicted outer membrane repeat protein
MVIVADGIYTGADNRSLIFSGKALFFTSENGPDNCIIDLENLGRAVFFWGDQDSSTVFQGFTIRNGHVADGGGIYIRDNSEAHLSDNIFHDNTAVEYGGGIHIESNSIPQINNCLFDSNGAEMSGGAVYSSSMAYGVRLLSCTFDGNWALDPEGGSVIRNPSGTYIIMTNSIVAGNGAIYPYIRGGSFNINYCFIIFTGWPSGSGNIGEPPNADPRFTTGPGGDFYLLPSSPCLDAGSDDASVITVHTSDGAVPQQLRTTNIYEVQDTDTVDMGYHYTHYLEKFVPYDFGTMQAAIDASLYGDTIMVLAGTRFEDVDFDGKTVILKGAAGAEYCTIRGSISMAEHVQWPAALLDFTITGNSGTSAIYIGNASCPLVQNNIITGNSSGAVSGAGISTEYDNSVIRDNQVLDNETGQYGGGIYITHWGEPLIEGNWIADNVAGIGGGGLSIRVGAEPTLRRNIFVGNSAYEGGGLHVYNTFGTSIEQCTVVDNEATDGAGIFFGLDIVTIDNCLIAFNNVGAATYC